MSRVRLTEHEIAAIKDCVRRHFGAGAVVRLFGSRTDHARAGGDIDLHVTLDASDLPGLAIECDFKEDLYDRIGEQRIDVLTLPRGFKLRPIDHMALNDGIVL